MTKLHILCLDPDGGFGGSARSLLETIKQVDPNQIALEVWCRRRGPVVSAYEDLGVDCIVRNDMPSASSLPTLSRNLYYYLIKFMEFYRARKFKTDLARKLNSGVDLVHLNHEGLFLLARWLKKHSKTPRSMHIRKSITNTIFARWQMRLISRSVDGLFFITENEERRFEEMGGFGTGRVIYNIFCPSDKTIEPLPELLSEDGLKVACLSNYSWSRGIDRLVDVASSLKKKNRSDILFVIAGDMQLPKGLPGVLGEVARKGGQLSDYASHRGVADMFRFLGHVSEPESVLAGCELLVKPTRQANPWGRDIIEALGMERPVLSVGTWDTFVRNGETGLLTPEFDADVWAKALIEFADDRDGLREMGIAGRKLVTELCNPVMRSGEVVNEWRTLAGRTNA